MPTNYLHVDFAQDLVGPLIFDDLLGALDHLVYLVFEGLERGLLVETHDAHFEVGGLSSTGFWTLNSRPS